MTSAAGQCHGWLGLVRSIASSFKPILGPSSSSGLSLPSRVFSLTVGNARAHNRGRFSRAADQPATGPSVVGAGRARSQRPARRAPLPKITGCLSSSPARGLTNRRERERGPKWAPTRALAHLPCKSTNRARFCNFPAFEQYLLIAEVAIGPSVTEPLWNSNVARFRNLYC